MSGPPPPRPPSSPLSSSGPVIDRPSLLWRSTSYQVVFGVAALCRAFMYGLNKTEAHGLDRFLNLLRNRSDYTQRTKGLLTVSNHVSVMDDPLMWAVLPLGFTFQNLYMSHRWSFGSHDICFKNSFSATFFTLGQTLPTLRIAHSPPGSGGLFQPTITEGIRLLSRIPGPAIPSYQSPSAHPHFPHDIVDPFSALPRPPSYNPGPPSTRSYLSPSSYPCNSYSWIHIFPEGKIHQAPNNQKTMRYFKWGVSRLILEPPECPDIVPIFIDGTNEIMHESRSFPRFVPRTGKHVSVTFGEAVDTEQRFGDLRRRWRELKAEEDRELEDLSEKGTGDGPGGLGELGPKMMYGKEAVELRRECTRRVREEVLKVRRSSGLPDEDPKFGLVETWEHEGDKREGKMKDGSWIKDT